MQPESNFRFRCYPNPYLAVPAALAASDLIATIPSRAATLIAAHADLTILPLPVDFSATISIAWHRRAASEPAQVWFREILTAAAGEWLACGNCPIRY